MAVEEERSRMTRDLHDILGHSLTVITVKAELASRLIGTDQARAATEIADIERLAREALTDVRATIAGNREVSLAPELVNARAALASANIDADAPRRRRRGAVRQPRALRLDGPRGCHERAAAQQGVAVRRSG